MRDQPSPPDADSYSTGLPLLSTWPRIYAFILISFALFVLALIWLSRAFS